MHDSRIGIPRVDIQFHRNEISPTSRVGGLNNFRFARSALLSKVLFGEKGLRLAALSCRFRVASGRQLPRFSQSQNRKCDPARGLECGHDGERAQPWSMIR